MHSKKIQQLGHGSNKINKKHGKQTKSKNAQNEKTIVVTTGEGVKTSEGEKNG